MSKWIYFLIFLQFGIVYSHQNYLKNETRVISISELGAKDIQITSHPLCEYPDICLDNNNDIWVAYTEMEEDKEFITLNKIVNLQLVDSFLVSSVKGMEYKPRILCDEENRIWIVWSAKRNNNWDIYARSLKQGKFSEEIRLTSHPSVDINPEIAADQEGNIHVVWETLRNNNFDIYSLQFNLLNLSQPKAVSASQKMELRPVIKIDSENNVFASWDRQNKNSYSIILKQLYKSNSPEIQVSPSKGFNQAPSIAFDKNNYLTVAYQSDLQPNGEVGLTPWIYLKKYKDLKEIDFFTLASPGDWEKNLEDQGFEFPTIGFDPQNRAWITGRPSQGFFAQVTDGKKKSDIYRFDVPGWGGRGKQARFVFTDDGTIYSVRRDIRYIYLNSFSTQNDHIDLIQPVEKIQYEFNAKISESKKIIKQIFELPGDYKILFGDLHQHSWISDGMGTADACYTRSKHVYGYDFATLTDHEWFVNNLIMPSEWEWIKIISEKFNNESDFFTYAAYEWTTPRLPKGFGHKNVFFLDWDKPIFSLKTDAKNTDNLFALLKENNAFAVPHHIGWTGTDWDHHDEIAQPNVEIVSAHGAFEYMGNEPITHRGGMPGYFVQDGLAKGLKFGLIGSSDGHGLRWHHGIARKKDEWQTGLTAVIVKDKSREAIFEALQKRRVYASSGVPIKIDFRINNHWMGEEITLNSPPEIQISVTGTNKIHYVILLRDNKEILYMSKDINFGKGVIQEDGEMAWSSPIWVNYQK
jgi:hypothetical protein